jgi:probable phosphoglycerate mutase
MTSLLLIRHADTDAVSKVLAGRSDRWKLNETGKEQAMRLASRLASVPIAAIYTSPLRRTIETAEVLGNRLQLAPQPHQDLVELDYGEWEDQSFADLAGQPEWIQFNRFKSSLGAPGGESMLDVQARMIRSIEAIRRAHGDAVVAIVSHAEPIRVAIAYFLGIALDLIARIEIRPASVSVLRVSDQCCVARCLNWTEEFAL